MAPLTAKKSASSKTPSSRRTKKTNGKSPTKPKDENRVSKPAKAKESYSDKAVEARRAKDAETVDTFHENSNRMQKLIRRGPMGEPIYDTQGFELDYEKVSKATKLPRKRTRNSKAHMKMVEQRLSDDRSIKEIIGLSVGDVCATVLMAAQDRVARDLDMPYHKVEVEHYRSWKALGFHVDPETFKLENISEPERDRLLSLATGSALRK